MNQSYQLDFRYTTELLINPYGGYPPVVGDVALTSADLFSCHTMFVDSTPLNLSKIISDEVLALTLPRTHRLLGAQTVPALKNSLFMVTQITAEQIQPDFPEMYNDFISPELEFFIHLPAFAQIALTLCEVRATKIGATGTDN